LKYGKPDPSMMANGTLAGLVAITAPCAFVTAPSAVFIGGVAGVLVCVAVFFIDARLRIDDPVGAISVHGVNGLWGILSLGLLADGPYGDGWNGVAGGGRGPPCRLGPGSSNPSRKRYSLTPCPPLRDAERGHSGGPSPGRTGMKLISAVVRPERLPQVKAALFRAGVTGITINRVSGHGGEH